MLLFWLSAALSALPIPQIFVLWPRCAVPAKAVGSWMGHICDFWHLFMRIWGWVWPFQLTFSVHYSAETWFAILNFTFNNFFLFLMKYWLLRAGVWSYLGCLEENTECDDLQDLWQGLCLNKLVSQGGQYLFLHNFLGYVLAYILYAHRNFSQKKFGRANLCSGIAIQASIVFSIYTPATDVLSENAQSIFLAAFMMLSSQVFADVLYLYW